MLFHTLFTTARGAARALAQAWKRRQALQELGRLDGRGLHDLGLAAGDTWAAADAYGRGDSYRCGGRFVETGSREACAPSAG